MFEEQYRKYCREIIPPPALNEETIALMQEAQNHRTAPQEEAPLRWRPKIVLPIAGTAAAAVVALVITGAWLLKGDGEHYDDTLSDNFESFFESEIQEEQSQPSTEDGEGKPEGDDATADTLLPEGNEAEDELKSNPGENNDATPEDKPGTTPPSSGNTEPETPQEDENSSETKDENSTPPSEDKEESTEPKDEPSNPEVPAVPSDPYGPETSHEKGVETYLSIREFIDALAKKETGGYGKNYYNARELLIVPNLLPDGARFRHLHLNTKNGSYNYSYYFAKDGKDYIIDIEINTKLPKNLTELRVLKQSVATEEVLTAKKGDQLYFLFGKRDEVTVTLTDVKATVLLTEEETAALLTQFKLERCSLNNPIVDMKY